MILAVYCAGGLGREIIELARSIHRWDKIVFVDDITENKICREAEVMRFSEIERFRGELEFVIANGEPSVRELLYGKIKAAGYPMATLIGPHCRILPETEIGEGCILGNCNISTHVRLGANLLINAGAIIGHDVAIKDHSIISSGTFLGGGTQIGKRVYIAPGALVKDRIKIGDDAIVGLGAVILRNVRAESIMIGNPAKKWGENSEKTVFHRFS